MEAFRRADPRISHEDIVGRFPVRIDFPANGQPIRTPLARKGAISARSRRYRESSGTVTWEGREGSGKLREYFWSLLPQYCKDNNLAIPRDLTEIEKAHVATINLGKYPKRARKVPTLPSGRKRMTHEQYVKSINDRKAAAVDQEARKEDNKARRNTKTRRRKAAADSQTTEAAAEAPVDDTGSLDLQQDLTDETSDLSDVAD